jgi:DNA-binding response OmpR family regulator
MDRVLAFESGADDFLAKPFYPPELGARVSAVLRGFVARPASPPRGTPPTARFSSIRAPGRVIADGRRVELTPRERELLSGADRAGGARRAPQSS